MTKPLSNTQIEILQSFNYELSEQELRSFREMLVDYFASKISDDIDSLFDEKGWDDSQSEEWATSHLRTPYNGPR